jgi:hypothetical protein
MQILGPPGSTDVRHDCAASFVYNVYQGTTIDSRVDSSY